MASDALAQGFDELMWIDSDIMFDPDDVDKLRQHNLPLVCGIYPKKSRRQFACAFLPQTRQVLFGAKGGLMEILYCGFGFTMTRRVEKWCQFIFLSKMNRHHFSPTPFLSTGGGTGGGGTGGTTGSTGGGTTGTTGGGLPGNGGTGGGVYVSGMPVGLRDVSQLALGFLNASTPYAEAHTIARGETNTVTIEQSGGGTSGTWSVTVTGSTNSSDIANGSGGGTTSTAQISESASGTATAKSNYNLVMSGTYSNGTFTLTSETYYATGSSNSSQTNSETSSSYWGDSFSENDSTYSDIYTQSWSASISDTGGMVFNSYSLTEIAKAYSHNQSSANGEYGDATSTAVTTMTASGQGDMANYSESETLGQTFEDNGTTSSQNQSNPVSGTVYIGGLLDQPSGWQWLAGASNATYYTFNGGASEKVTLVETATWQTGGSGSSLVVNSFNSYYKGTASGQVQDDEAETPASSTGTDLFERNETYGFSDTVTGSGSYGGGNTNATFQSVQVGTFNVADTEWDNNETVTGTDADGNPYTLNYSYVGGLTGSGSFMVTNNFQDLGNGLALTSESYQDSGSAQSPTTYSGTYNGQAFNESWNIPESFDDPVETLAGSLGVVTSPDGLVNAFPFQDTVTPNGAVYGAAGNGGVFLQLPLPPKGPLPGIQDWYNSKIVAAGEKGKKKVADTATHNQVMDHIRLTQNAKDTFTLQSGDGGGRGRIFAQAVGDADKLKKAQDSNLAAAKTRLNSDDLKEGRCDVIVTYAVDGAINPTRSGNVVVVYKYQQTYTGTDKDTGKPVSSAPIILGGKAVQFHDDNLENMSGLK
ncbi:MAG TPA: hypothetical protein VH592_17185 [Gemmataceae bacterium]